MKIIGNGIDIIEIERIEAAVKRHPRLLLGAFTDTEREHFALKNNSFATIAGCFAAKEAVVKALGTGFSGIMPRDVCISWDDKGKPMASVSKVGGRVHFFTSISHSKKYAVASVIAFEE